MYLSVILSRRYIASEDGNTRHKGGALVILVAKEPDIFIANVLRTLIRFSLSLVYTARSGGKQ